MKYFGLYLGSAILLVVAFQQGASLRKRSALKEEATNECKDQCRFLDEFYNDLQTGLSTACRTYCFVPGCVEPCTAEWPNHSLSQILSQHFIKCLDECAELLGY